MRHRSFLAALGCAAMFLGGAARAVEDSAGKDKALEEARQHAAKAKVHYDLGEFEQAAEEYTIVYRLRPLPALLFNIAQSYRQAGQYEKAKQFYKAYLRESPDAKNSAQVKSALKEIDELLAKEKKTRDAPPAGVRDTPTDSSHGVAGAAVGGAAAAGAAAAAIPPPSVPPTGGATPAGPAVAGGGSAAVPTSTIPAGSAVTRQPAPAQAVTGTTTTAQVSSRPYKTYAYISAGAAVVLLGGGLAFMSKASKYEDELNARPHPANTISDLSSTASSSRTLSAVMLGAGTAAAVGAGLLYFLPTGDGVAVQGKF